MNRWMITMILAVATLCACGSEPQATDPATGAANAATPEGTSPLAIVGATLVNPDAAPVADAVVVMRDGRIVAAGPRGAVEIPAGVERIDATGKWLVPGYVDAHVHFFQSGGLYARPGMLDLREIVPYEQEVANTRANLDDTFRRYLRSGITTVLDTGGPMWNFDVRKRARSTRYAPRVFVAGPLISTAKLPPSFPEVADPPFVTATSPEQARALVDKQASLKPDFIKIWFIVKPGETPQQHLPVVKAVIDEAHRQHLRVAVHAMELETARAAVRAGADVLVHSVTDKPVDTAFIALLKQRHIPYVPTLGVMQGYDRVYFQQPGLTAEEHAWGSPDAIATFADLGRIAPDLLPDFITQASEKGWKPMPPTVAEQNLKTVQDAGVLVASGTDAGNTGMLHGASYFRELALMADAGLTPAQILADSTLGGARLLGRDADIGTIAPGKFADMVVLGADPLDDVANFSRIDAVVKQGHYLPADSILGDGQKATTERDPDAFRALGPQDQPEAVVQRQLEAFNRHDIEAFVETYSPDIEIFTLDGERISQGRQSMRAYYGERFESAPKLHCDILNRIVQGNYVIDHEHLTGYADGGTFDGIAIYELHRGEIRRVWFPQ